LPVVIGLQLPEPGEVQRIRCLWADVQLAPLVLTYTISRKRSRQLEVRPPTIRDGGDGVILPDDLAEAVRGALPAAVQADPAAREHLFRRHW